MRDPSAYRLYLIYCGVTSFLFALAFTVVAVYRVQSAGLSPLQLVLVGTTLEVTYFLFNVPTGVVLWSLAFALEGAIPVFAWILVAQAVSALGYTFVEGAIEAWLTDEIGEEALGPALLRGGQVGRMAAFCGIGGSVALASVRLNLPLLVTGASFLLFGFYLIAVMREPGFRRPPRIEAFGPTNRTRSALRETAGTTRAGARVMRRRPLALTVVAVAAIFGGFSEGFDRLWEAHFLGPIGLPGLGRLEPVVWFGIIEAGAMLLGIGAAELFRRRVDLERPAASIRALFGLEAVLMAAVVAFALAGSFALAVATYWLASAARGLVGPVYLAWINRGVDPQARATVLSMTAQADALGQFTVGPGLGAIGSAFGLRAALTTAGLALTPALALYGRALGKVSQGQEVVAEPVDASG